MKTRIGFVSNSSSTSFIIAGTLFNSKDFIETFELDEEEFKANAENSYDLDVYEKQLKLDIEWDAENDSIWAGKSIARGTGWYGSDFFDTKEFLDAIDSPEVQILKDKDCLIKIHIGQYGE